ncbi:Glutathione transport system permease protein GsiC [Microbacterium lemovicicum]|uniref:Glutathione transport system permease protein GsiC n=1 Tax=Microbacterium lemovicicum TaxID=1072463 RepID=A0A3Q9J0E8_9MICO|nr:ABC transporter permease [Microbacterium lemovicicum]AZS35714.1 Glutathione transport system permease protein GsiC [Microbacterium lemovicicum]
MFAQTRRRAVSLAVVLAIGSVVAFAVPRLAPGDVAVTLAGPNATPENIEAIRERLGLDRPEIVQFFDWIGGLFRGDLGTSYVYSRSVASLIGDRLDSTLQLALLAALFVAILATVLGVLMGSSRQPRLRAVLDVVSSLLIAVPSFLVGLLFILAFGVLNRWLPISGQVSVTEDVGEGLRYLLLPALALSLSAVGVISRLIGTDMRTMREEEFVYLATSKGASRWRITLRHVLPNSLNAAIVAFGLTIGDLLAGAIVIEALFNRQGLGQLAVLSVQSRDFAVLQVLILGAVVVAAVFQILTEVAIASLDPRIRAGVSAR